MEMALIITMVTEYHYPDINCCNGLLLPERPRVGGERHVIIHVDMPDLGKTKFLKLAVIQQVFVPDHY
jgi:hypothetical protein